MTHTRRNKTLLWALPAMLGVLATLAVLGVILRGTLARAAAELFYPASTQWPWLYTADTMQPSLTPLAGALLGMIGGWLLLLAAAVMAAIPAVVIYTVLGLGSGAERLFLVGKYLGRKVSPLFAAAAVMLCTAMVIIVISIMGGFLNTLRDSAHTLAGDVTIRAGGLSGFPHYDELIERLRELPEVEAATPLIRWYGLVQMGQAIHPVDLHGIDPVGMAAVTGLGEGETLFWDASHIEGNATDDTSDFDAADRRMLRARYNGAIDFRAYGRSLQPPAEWNTDLPAIVPGIHVAGSNPRLPDGSYDIRFNTSLASEATLTVVPVTGRGGLLEPSVRKLVVVNEFKSGLYEIDQNRVYVPFALLQEMLKLDADQAIDPATGMPTGELIPARATEILVRTRAGLDVDVARQAVRNAVYAFSIEQPNMPSLFVETWMERFGQLLGAVEKEKFLVTILFAFISIVAVAMIGVVFYMIVIDKTWDIGVLRACGASASGIVVTFLGYGLVLGLLGATLGTLLAAAIVWNINPIQDFLASQFGRTAFCVLLTLATGLMGLVIGGIVGSSRGRMRLGMGLGTAIAAVVGLVTALLAIRFVPALNDVLSVFNFQIWNAQTYYFDRIPSQLDPFEVAVIYLGAVLSSVVGAVVPAVRAGLLVPVEALRYE